MFDKYVEVGRAVVLTKGSDADKLAVIVDIIDHNRALVQCEAAGVKRKVALYKRMKLLDLVVSPFPAKCKSGAAEKAIAKFGLMEKWSATAEAKKIALRQRRASLNDFERFQASVLRRRYSRIVDAAFKQLQGKSA